MTLTGVRAVTLDFGNALVRIDRAALRDVVARTAESVVKPLGLGAPGAFLAAWAEERDRQFREEVPRFREVNLQQRAVRVVARLRGMSAPPHDEAWADAAAALRSTTGEIALIVEAYSGAFVARIPAPASSGRVIYALANRGFLVAILSNWPLGATIDRFAEAAGWMPDLAGIFVSERIGIIKPHPAIFAHAEAALGLEPADILHVGDDWTADVTGAAGAGWRSAYLIGHQGDTPLPTSEAPPDASPEVRPDLEIRSLDELGAHLADPPAEWPTAATP
ncbi:MAG: HAD family hydrolase [Chloroflexi bacterium]|nr:HAD family hydrolase [Chloroflexota bacterium]